MDTSKVEKLHALVLEYLEWIESADAGVDRDSKWMHMLAEAAIEIVPDGMKRVLEATKDW